MLITLANLPKHPDSVPINMLVKCEGTPMFGAELLTTPNPEREKDSARATGNRQVWLWGKTWRADASQIVPVVTGDRTHTLSVAAQLREHGLLLRPLGNVVYMLPPYYLNEEDLDRSWETVREIMLAVTR
ncbi:MAG TPA: hypothetical protein DD979_13250 [Gammaproteobacteria bacterium]|nr:hypothetical protein [Gammaproteobacteria bacterium]